MTKPYTPTTYSCRLVIIAVPVRICPEIGLYHHHIRRFGPRMIMAVSVVEQVHTLPVPMIMVLSLTYYSQSKLSRSFDFRLVYNSGGRGKGDGGGGEEEG